MPRESTKDPNPAKVAAALRELLYHRVRLTGPGLAAEGRIAAIAADLVTLAAPDGAVVLVPVRRVKAVTVCDPTPVQDQSLPAPPQSPGSWPAR